MNLMADARGPMIFKIKFTISTGFLLAGRASKPPLFLATVQGMQSSAVLLCPLSKGRATPEFAVQEEEGTR